MNYAIETLEREVKKQQRRKMKHVNNDNIFYDAIEKEKELKEVIKFMSKYKDL